RPGPDPYRAYRREAERIISPGFRAMKMKVGVDPEADGRAASAVRRVVGPDVILLADANQGYTVRPAIESGRRIEAAGFARLPEPHADAVPVVRVRPVPEPAPRAVGCPGGGPGRHDRGPAGAGARDGGRPRRVRALSPAPRRSQPRLSRDRLCGGPRCLLSDLTP